MSDILGVDDDRERSPLHENRDTVLDMENRDRFKPRVRRSGVKQQGPLVRFVYLVRCTDSFYWNWVKRISRKNRFKKNILKPINCIFLINDVDTTISKLWIFAIQTLFTLFISCCPFLFQQTPNSSPLTAYLMISKSPSFHRTRDPFIHAFQSFTFIKIILWKNNEYWLTSLSRERIKSWIHFLTPADLNEYVCKQFH